MKIMKESLMVEMDTLFEGVELKEELDVVLDCSDIELGGL